MEVKAKNIEVEHIKVLLKNVYPSKSNFVLLLLLIRVIIHAECPLAFSAMVPSEEGQDNDTEAENFWIRLLLIYHLFAIEQFCALILLGNQTFTLFGELLLDPRSFFCRLFISCIFVLDLLFS